MNTDHIDFNRRRILIVEDDYLIAHEMALNFRSYGAEVVGPVGTIETALNLVGKDDAIDLAVLDINLRGELVYPLADVLFDRGVPFLFATGYSVETMPSDHSRAPYLTKPVDPRAIAVALDKLQRSREAKKSTETAALRFRVRALDSGWAWELYTADGEMLASGTSDSSAAARAGAFQAALLQSLH